MGMFDHIKCNFPLKPCLKSQGTEIADYDFQGTIYQTKDLECALDLYTIREDGTLCTDRHEYEWIKSDPKDKSGFGKIGHNKITRSWVEEVPKTITITFYESVREDQYKNDYRIEFEVVFVKGMLTNITNTKFEATDNTERKIRDAAWKAKMASVDALRKKWYMKYLYLPYVGVIRFIFRKYNDLKQHIIPAYKVEHWLTPW